MQGISVSFSGIFCVFFLNFYNITHQVQHKKKKKTTIPHFTKVRGVERAGGVRSHQSVYGSPWIPSNIHLWCLQQLTFSNSPWKTPPLVKYSQRLPNTWKTTATMQWDAFSVTKSRVHECSSLLVLWQAILPLWPCGLKEAVSMSARRSIRWKFPSLSLQSTTSELENMNKSESLCLMIHSFFIRLAKTENKLSGSLCHKPDRAVNKAKDLFQR